MARVGLAIASLVPLCAYLSSFALQAQLEQEGSVGFRAANGVLLPYGAITLVFFAAVAVFVVHARQNERLGERQRRNWTLGLIFLNVVALPLYWWQHVRAC